MADSYDFFNPDVQGVPIPDTNVTRPISPLKANTGGELIGQGLGTALKDTGELIKDAKHLEDYTNKTELLNRLHATDDALDEADNARLRAINTQLLGASGGGVAGARAEADNADVTNAIKIAQGQGTPPDDLTEGAFPHKVKTLNALKIQDTQGGMYAAALRAKIAKEYRTQFPQYRKYIDQVMGNTANQYHSALERANSALMAAGEQGDNKVRDTIMNNLKELESQEPGLPSRLLKGLGDGSMNELQVTDKIAKTLAHMQNLKDQDQRLNNAKLDTSQRGEEARGVSSAQTSMDARYALTNDDLGETIKGYINLPQSMWKEDMSVAAAYDTQRLIDRVKEKARDRDSARYNVRAVGPDGKETYVRGPDGNFLTSSKYEDMRRAGINYEENLDQSVKSLTDIRDRLHKGELDMAKATDLKTQAMQHENLAAIFRGKEGQILGLGKQLESISPEGAKQFVANAVNAALKASGKGDVTEAERGALVIGLEQAAANGTSLAEYMNNLGIVNMNNGKVNYTMMNQAVHSFQEEKNSTIRDNLANSLYSQNPSLADKLPTSALVDQYRLQTSPESMRTIAKTSPAKQTQALEWTLKTGDKIAGPLLKQLENLTDREGKSASEQYRFTYNDAAHEWKAEVSPTVKDSPRLVDLHRRIDMLNETYAKPLTEVAQGYARMLSQNGATPEDVNKAVLDMIHNSGFVNNKVWESVNQMGAARAKARADAAKAKEDAAKGGGE